MTLMEARLADETAGLTEDLDVQRAALRVTSDFFLRNTSLLSGLMDGDLIKGLVWLAIVEANVRRLVLDRDLDLAYAGSDQPPPDEMRRPVSVYALSHTLRLPYETTRRYVGKLIQSGQACRVEGGVIVSVAAMEATPVREASNRFHANLRRYLNGLGLLGVTRSILGRHGLGPNGRKLRPAPVRPAVAEAAPNNLRRIGRATNAFYLQTADTLADVANGDLILGIVLLGVVQANIQPLNTDIALSMRYSGVNDIPPDDLRRPVSVYSLAQSLDLPYETTRRYVKRLIDEGRCERVSAGIVVPRTVLADPSLLVGVRRNYANIESFLLALSRADLDLGVLPD